MTATEQNFPALPCYPCPYDSSCCAYGVSLTDEEAAAIEANHGQGLVYKTRWGEWRTRIKNKRCAMMRDGGCSIHDKSYYPTTCRGFPWTDDVGGRYEFDITICGEFEKRPELVTIQRATPPAK
ncbi:MAG TPA: YkgJ family cysteine cluster protein [Gemmatimonadaceae bacterium]